MLDEDVGGLSARTNQNGQYIIHQGGDVLVNDVEIGLANYYLTWDENYLPNVPDFGIVGSNISVTSEMGYYWDVNKILAYYLGLGDFAFGAYEGANQIKIPGIIGMIMDASARLTRDEGMGYSPHQKALRCTVVSLEGLVVNGLATTAGLAAGGIGAFSGPDPSDLSSFIFTYTVLFSTGAYLADQVNNQLWFPLIDQIP